MARMWTSFVTDLDPNGHGGEFIRLKSYNALRMENARLNARLYYSSGNRGMAEIWRRL
jgi:hypothetical protein